MSSYDDRHPRRRLTPARRRTNRSSRIQRPHEVRDSRTSRPAPTMSVSIFVLYTTARRASTDTDDRSRVHCVLGFVEEKCRQIGARHRPRTTRQRINHGTISARCAFCEARRPHDRPRARTRPNDVFHGRGIGDRRCEQPPQQRDDRTATREQQPLRYHDIAAHITRAKRR